MLTKADKILLDGIRSGDAEVWGVFVNRFQGRLTSFAMRALNGKLSDAEDLVQETFIACIKSLNSFEGKVSLESWVFMILRRRLIDQYRKHASSKICSINDLAAKEDDSNFNYETLGAGDNMTASRYVSNDEVFCELKGMLAAALREITDRSKKKNNFRDIKIIELAFYAGLGNKSIASCINEDPKTVGLVKHRCLEKLKESLAGKVEINADNNIDGMLVEIWQEQRFTCPKRSTIGSWRLGSLDEEWAGYVDFHINNLGCNICLANLEDLDNELNKKAEYESVCQRIFESSIGFLKS